jgi:hypothetical protein
MYRIRILCVNLNSDISPSEQSDYFIGQRLYLGDAITRELLKDIDCDYDLTDFDFIEIVTD